MTSRSAGVVCLAAIAAAGCDLPDDPPAAAAIATSPVPSRLAAEPRALRWLPGFAASAISERPSRRATERLDALASVDDACRGAGTEAFAVIADVVPGGGDDTVLASVAQGVVLADAREHVVATAPLADCGGSADEMVALAVGDAWIGVPVIAVVATVGGHRESDTEVTLFATGDDRRLDRIFSGVLEERDGDDLREGSVFVIPGVIVERALDGTVHFFTFDREAHRFREGGVDPDDRARTQ